VDGAWVDELGGTTMGTFGRGFRRLRGSRLLLLAAIAFLAAGCGSGSGSGQATSAAPTAAPAAATTASSASPTTGGSGGTGAEGVLAPPERATTAVTYNPALAPEGATIKVDVNARGGSTEVRLDVRGLLPSRGYAAHAHVNPCGPTGDVAGPHFQNQVDPAAAPGKPSTDPAYANPQNEIWLDLRTDGAGAGGSRVEVPFTFTGRAPASVVIHEAETTGTAPGQAGSAGARLACITVPFR
jgi:superoxide dismutase, Cu-Zn family